MNTSFRLNHHCTFLFSLSALLFAQPYYSFSSETEKICHSPLSPTTIPFGWNITEPIKDYERKPFFKQLVKNESTGAYARAEFSMTIEVNQNGMVLLFIPPGIETVAANFNDPYLGGSRGIMTIQYNKFPCDTLPDYCDPRNKACEPPLPAYWGPRRGAFSMGITSADLTTEGCAAFGLYNGLTSDEQSPPGALLFEYNTSVTYYVEDFTLFRNWLNSCDDSNCYPDIDGDGLGLNGSDPVVLTPEQIVSGICPAQTAPKQGDCDDTQTGNFCSEIVCYQDGDGDGLGLNDSAPVVLTPEQIASGICPENTADKQGDCDDNDKNRGQNCSNEYTNFHNAEFKMTLDNNNNAKLTLVPAEECQKSPVPPECVPVDSIHFNLIFDSNGRGYFQIDPSSTE